MTVLRSVIDRLIADKASAEDREQVQSAIAAGALSIATGQRAVSLGGDANGAVIVTGDGNVIVHVDSVEAIAWLLHRSHPSPLHQLPADVEDFAGREVQIEKLLRVLDATGARVAISAIDGMGGLGKTALAVHVAHRLTGRYPDAQVVVDMAGTSDAPLSPAQGLERVIRVFEPLMQLPDTEADLRPIYLSLLRGKRVLLILDNALDGDQVTPLVPPEDCALIVTSRRRIAVAGLVRIDLDLLAPDEAMTLLRSIVGDDRARHDQLSRIAERCGLLPLALRIAGMFLIANPHWSAERFITALTDEQKRLSRLKLEGNASLDVAANLALSVGELRRTHPDIADRWHELAGFPASFDITAAASVWDQPSEVADEILGALLLRSMVLYDPAQQRWRLHDLMRDLAGGRAAVEALGAPADLAARLTAARRRHAEYYCGLLAAADKLYLKGGDQVALGLALFDRERHNIESGRAWAAGGVLADPAAARLCVGYPLQGVNVLPLRLHPRQRIDWLETAVTAARKIGDRPSEGATLGNLGSAYFELGEPRRAIEFYEQHLTIAREIGDRRSEGQALGNLGVAYGDLGKPRRAIEFYEQNLTIAREIGARRSESAALSNLGVAYGDLGEPRRAIEFYEQHLTIAREIGDHRSEGAVLSNLGVAYGDLGEPRRAIEFYEQHLTIAREIGDRRSEGQALGNLGVALRNLGERRRSIECYDQQLTITREIGDRRGEGQALGNLGVAYGDLGEPRRAIEFYEQQLTIAREIGDRRSEGQALGNLGVALRNLGERRRSIECYDQQLTITREIGDRRGERQALGNLGVAYVDLGEPRRAIECYDQQLTITREIGDRRGEGTALGNLGVAYGNLGEPRRAIEFVEQNLTIAREIGDRRGEGTALANLGVAYKNLGEPRRAIEFLRGAVDIYDAIESPHAAQVRATIARLELEKEGGA
jgi:tetratricopeptide (TPR) repeat protein